MIFIKTNIHVAQDPPTPSDSYGPWMLVEKRRRRPCEKSEPSSRQDMTAQVDNSRYNPISVENEDRNTMANQIDHTSPPAPTPTDASSNVAIPCCKLKQSPKGSFSSAALNLSRHVSMGLATDSPPRPLHQFLPPFRANPQARNQPTQ
ncbi:hypothetical protein V6N13_128558 [Hibiscus sabdariffa]|uniref:Uncharacterized protein n=1 Tax=Hibiscus sabdariffa TaxID=183260 RepID=A0ABR2P0U7_9ROSI